MVIMDLYSLDFEGWIMDSDFGGGQGPASMPTGTYCGDLGTDKMCTNYRVWQ